MLPKQGGGQDENAKPSGTAWLPDGVLRANRATGLQACVVVRHCADPSVLHRRLRPSQANPAQLLFPYLPFHAPFIGVIGVIGLSPMSMLLAQLLFQESVSDYSHSNAFGSHAAANNPATGIAHGRFAAGNAGHLHCRFRQHGGCQHRHQGASAKCFPGRKLPTAASTATAQTASAGRRIKAGEPDDAAQRPVTTR